MPFACSGTYTAPHRHPSQPFLSLPLYPIFFHLHNPHDDDKIVLPCLERTFQAITSSPLPSLSPMTIGSGAGLSLVFPLPFPFASPICFDFVFSFVFVLPGEGEGGFVKLLTLRKVGRRLGGDAFLRSAAAGMGGGRSGASSTSLALEDSWCHISSSSSGSASASAGSSSLSSSSSIAAPALASPPSFCASPLRLRVRGILNRARTSFLPRMRRLSSCTRSCHCRVVEQEGQEPDVGRMDGVVVESVSFFSVSRKWVARQVRCVALLQDGEGQTRVLAPDSGSADEQIVQAWVVARSD